jgi:signal peptide peptidase SppA
LSHELHRIKKSILNTPHFIDQQALDNIMSYLDSRNSGIIELDYKAAIEADRVAKAQEKTKLSSTGIGLLPISGALTYERTMWEAFCGNTSYQTIQEQFDTFLEDESITTIVMDVNSGGGSAYSMMELARYMRGKVDKKGKHLIAYVDGLSASAAYGLSSAAHEIIMNPDAEVGSIGVVVRLSNSNKADKEKGIETTYVHAGASKIPFDSEGEFRKEFIEGIQSKIDILYENFTGMVAEMRNVDQQVIKNTEADTFMADKAVELGLADKAMTREEFFEYLADLSIGEDNMPLGASFNKLFSKNKEEVNMTDTVEQTVEATEVVEQDVEQSVSDVEASETSVEALAELETLKAALAEKENMLAELTELAEQQAQAKLAEDKANMDSFVSTLKFVDESARAELSDVLFSMRDTDGFELVKESLQKGAEAVETFASKEIGLETEETAPVSYDKQAQASVSEKLKQKSN